MKDTNTRSHFTPEGWDAGARSLEEPFDTPYGDRRCMIEDKWGNTWQIATQMGK
jgi:uncharacterized glyoxalase superfamily protein PhnB